MIIRDAKPDETRALAEAVAGQPLLTRYGVTVDGLARGLNEATAAGESLIVCETEGALDGFAFFSTRGQLGVGGYLKLIALRPGCEGGGRGKALLQEVEARVRASSRHLFLLVSDFNRAAQRFYEREGYHRCGEMPSLVKPEITELLYWRVLR
jgi:ribosomal protein S18 acetylase RimI-like enzyme